MPTMLPLLAQVIAIVVWASFFFLLVNAPLAASSRSGRGTQPRHSETADPLSLAAGRGRPLVWRRTSRGWSQGEFPPINSYRSH